jgi:hypothetical protein
LPPFDSDLANDSCDLKRSSTAFLANVWSTSEPDIRQLRRRAKTLNVRGQSADRIRRPRHHASDPKRTSGKWLAVAMGIDKSGPKVPAFGLLQVRKVRRFGSGAMA